jgi:hypothetical protein
MSFYLPPVIPLLYTRDEFKSFHFPKISNLHLSGYELMLSFI